MERAQRNVARVSTLISVMVSGTLALGFFGLTLEYTTVARVGGAIWVFLLSMIVSLPLVTSYFKRRYRGE